MIEEKKEIFIKPKRPTTNRSRYGLDMTIMEFIKKQEKFNNGESDETTKPNKKVDGELLNKPTKVKNNPNRKTATRKKRDKNLAAGNKPPTPPVEKKDSGVFEQIKNKLKGGDKK
jgi:hypothetical protein